jgi:hypothetical protein
MKETPRRRITVTSSLKRNIRGEGEALLRPPFYKQAFGSIIM